MQTNSYGELSEIIADLAHLDKRIQTKRYRVIRDQLDAFPFDYDTEVQVLDFLKGLRRELREIAQTEDART